MKGANITHPLSEYDGQRVEFATTQQGLTAVPLRTVRRWISVSENGVFGRPINRGSFTRIFEGMIDTDTIKVIDTKGTK